VNDSFPPVKDWLIPPKIKESYETYSFLKNEPEYVQNSMVYNLK